jgi:SSS family transporter
MTFLDWALFALYFVGIISFAMYQSRRNEGVEGYFLGNRRMPWWAIGLSVMATQASAITFIGTTGQAFDDGMEFVQFYLALPFAMVVLCIVFVPFFYRARVFTAYEYLERRFDARTRTLTSLLFLGSRGLAVGVTLYAPSLVLAVVLGISEQATILLMGGATIAYVMYGGNKSVIWTDVVQMGIIWFGILLCFGVAIAQLPEGFGLRDALALAQTTGRLDVMDTDPSLSQPYTLWGGLIGGLFLMLSYFGADQSQVQRYLSGSSLTQSRLSLLFNAFLKVPMQFLILLTGVLVFVFYHFHESPLLWNQVELARLEERAAPEELAGLKQRFAAARAEREAAARAFARARADGRAPESDAYVEANRRFFATRGEAVAAIERINGTRYNDNNYIFPSYILSQLPRGRAGLVIAVIFAAAMSTLSGEFNSLASASMVDFYKRFVGKDENDRRDLLISRIFTAFWGLFACLVALEAGRLGSAIEVVNKFGSYFYGSILGVFALAVLTPRATARGAFWGLFVGMATVAVVAQTTSVHFLWYNVIGAATVFVAGLLIGGLAPRAAEGA